MCNVGLWNISIYYILARILTNQQRQNMFKHYSILNLSQNVKWGIYVKEVGEHCISPNFMYFYI